MWDFSISILPLFTFSTHVKYFKGAPFCTESFMWIGRNSVLNFITMHRPAIQKTFKSQSGWTYLWYCITLTQEVYLLITINLKSTCYSLICFVSPNKHCIIFHLQNYMQSGLQTFFLIIARSATVCPKPNVESLHGTKLSDNQHPYLMCFPAIWRKKQIQKLI